MNVQVRSMFQGIASYTIYCTVAVLTLINWNNVSLRGKSTFLK